jgi:DNA-binding CsgD family transcriptional regulator
LSIVDTHSIIEMIYRLDGRQASYEELLDVLAEVWGAQWCTLSQTELHTGKGWAYGSKGYRDLQESAHEELSRMRKTYSEVYRQAPVYSRILGQETFQSPLDVLGSTVLASHVQGWLDEWRKLQGSATFLTSVLNCKRQHQSFLIVSFPDTVSEIRLERVKSQTFWLQHLSAAQQLRDQLPGDAERASVFSNVLEDLVWGVVIVGPENDVLFCNAAAKGLIDTWPGLKLYDNRLHVPESFLAKESGAVATLEDGEGGVVLHAMENPETENLLLMFAKPLRRGRDETNTGATVLFFHDTQSQDRDSVDVAQKVFGLTEAEAACMSLFMDGATRNEVAQTRGVSIETIRSQASSIIRKTGNQNMAGAIALCMHLNPPVIKS